MIHKFNDYNSKEQREIVFEIIRQKYIHNQGLNNFGNNCAFMVNLIKSFEAGQINDEDLKTKLEEFHNKNRKDIAEEVLFYFYNIAEGMADSADPAKASKFIIFGKIIKKIIDVDAISNTIQTPDDKMGDIDRGNGGFVLQSYSKYPSPAGYTPPPPPPPAHSFKNPYTSKDFKSICDYMRYKIFDEFEHIMIANFEDLEDSIEPTYLIPDSDEFINFPQWTDEDGDKEDLDFENPGDFIINDENSITFGGCGDWQEPQTFSFKLEKNGKIKAFDIEDGYSDQDSYGVENVIRIICELFGLNKNNYNINSTDPADMLTLYNDMVANKDFKLKLTKEITTEDCVDAIVDFFSTDSADLRNQKNWKRKSKTGSGIFIRVFENKITKDQVKVTSTKTEIINIEKI